MEFEAARSTGQLNPQSKVLEDWYREQAKRALEHAKKSADSGLMRCYWQGREESFLIAAEVLQQFSATGDLPTARVSFA